MDVSRARSALRGWGGVATMAVLCALALAFVLLLPCTQRAPEKPERERAGRTVATGVQARADGCVDSEAHERTLTPSDADGPTIDAIRARTGAKRKLIVGVDQNSYRWGYRNPNTEGAQLEGFDIELVRRMGPGRHRGPGGGGGEGRTPPPPAPGRGVGGGGLGGGDRGGD
ncbi:hypothetical protein ACWGKX_12075, partial [Streptomyces tricolor]